MSIVTLQEIEYANIFNQFKSLNLYDTDIGKSLKKKGALEAPLDSNFTFLICWISEWNIVFSEGGS